MMNTEKDSNLESVLESIEMKLKTLEEQQADLHNQIAVKRAQIQRFTKAIEILNEMDAN